MAPKQARTPPRKPSDGRAQQADDDGTGRTCDGNAKRHFDVTEVEGFIPIERLKNGWALPEYDPDNPEHVGAARSLANLLLRVVERLAEERRAAGDAEAIVFEPRFVRLGRERKAMSRR